MGLRTCCHTQFQPKWISPARGLLGSTDLHVGDESHFDLTIQGLQGRIKVRAVAYCTGTGRSNSGLKNRLPSAAKPFTDRLLGVYVSTKAPDELLRHLSSERHQVLANTGRVHSVNDCLRLCRLTPCRH